MRLAMLLPFGSATAAMPLLPLMVFVAEMCVVTVSTIRIIFISRGKKYLASFLGFFEVSIWLFAIGQIMQNLSDLSCFAAFAAGFTIGNFLGILIEKKLALGSLAVNITTQKDARALVEVLQAAECRGTCLEANGIAGPVRVVVTVIRRKELPRVLATVKAFDPAAFYVVNEVQLAGEEPAALGKERPNGILPTVLKLQRAA
jgi:uncharacterized protein YebE (UPF0316 family)